MIDLIDLHKISLSFSYNCLFHTEPDMVSMHCVSQIGTIYFNKYLFCFYFQLIVKLYYLFCFLGELNFNSTFSKLLLGINILTSLSSKPQTENPLSNSTLVQDSMNTLGNFVFS